MRINNLYFNNNLPFTVCSSSICANISWRTKPFPSPGHHASHFSVPTAFQLCLNVFHLEEILGFTLKMTADTLQTLTKLEVERSRKIRRIMNKFPSHPHGQDILFTTQFFASLYPVNEISNTCEGAAFKLLFSLESWHWKKERGIPPNDRRAITGPVPFGEQSDAGKCNKRLPPVGLFEAFPLLILKVYCEKEGRRRWRGGQRTEDS